jgi:tetratricopeptide (TPR) repeat protein
VTPGRATATATGAVVDAEPPTTAGVIALGNLHAQIAGQAREATAGRLDASGQGELVELLLLRGHLLGSIADYDEAEARAEQLTHDRPTDGIAFLARARTRAMFHRFTDALGDLDDALRLGADRTDVDAERAAIFQAVGRYDEAFTVFRNAVDRRADFRSLAALASLCAERGDVATAEHLFHESRDHFRGVSPFPLAQLDFRRAHMWLAQGDLHQARRWLSAAQRRLPDYAPAQGHLAEVEAALGETDSAIARLRLLTITSDDPDYAAQLARILSEVGRVEEAREHRVRAASRYDELLASHPEAFADHGAEFWLEVGADPQRALSLATMNLEVRRTPRARELHSRAMNAVGDARPESPISHRDGA